MIRIFIFNIFFWLFMVGCDIREDPVAKDSLECLLNTYLDYRPEHLNGEVLIDYTAGWSDSTAIISILTMNTQELEWIGTLYKSHYKGRTIYLGVSEFANVSQTRELPLDSFPISGNLIFNEVNIHSENTGNLNPELAEIQLVYHIKRKCIQNLILGDENSQDFFKKCKWCK